MSQNLYPPTRAQTVREVLQTGTKIFRLTLAATLPYAILIAICGNLANLRNLSLDLPLQNLLTLQSADAADPIWWAWNVAGSILTLLFGSALLLRQKALAAGESTSALTEVRQAAVLLSRLIVCVALSTFVVSLALLPFIYALPLTGLTPALTNPAALNPVMLLLLIPLSLPAAWLSLGLFFAPVALVLKKLGPIEAMRVSFRLLRGNWWRTSVLSAALAGVLIVTLVFATTAAAVAAMGFGVSDLKRLSELAIPLGILGSALFVPWCGAQLLAMLGDLTVRQKEAARPEVKHP
ncbi:MAG TPA: hypothetical protein VHW25_17410 [Steroidobacteraceae bacterium]|nr:hypothetical protein [Steroidobacteraceae bacterium]